MSLIIAYILTFIGVIGASVMDLPPFGIFLSLIGIVITVVHALRESYGKLGWLISIGAHALLWILYLISPDAIIGFLLNLMMVLVAFLILAFLALKVMGMFGKDENETNNSSEDTARGSVNPLATMPGIIYDGDNSRWTRRGIYGDHSLYYDENGNEINIFTSDVYGSSANTDKGTFHW